MKIGLVIYGSLDLMSGGYLYDRKLVAYLRSQPAVNRDLPKRSLSPVGS